MKFQTILLVIEVGGTLAFAMSGLLEAIRKRMDIVGVFSVAFVSAFGGGTVRDLLLDRRPLFWVQNQEYVWLVIALALTAPLWLKTFQHRFTENSMEVADACGLGLFAISGASIATAAGMSPGSFSAPELTLTLSAPHFSTRSKSSSVLMPPPTVRGIKISPATRVRISVKRARPSKLAVIS